MIEIQLLGDLAQFGPIPALEVRSATEAIRFISDQIPAFRDFLYSTAADAYQVIVDGRDIGEDQLDWPAITSIVIQPVFAGAGLLGRIILGVVLLGVSFIMPAAFLGIASTTVGAFGVALALGGIVGLLTPKPEEQKSQDSFGLDPSGLGRSTQGQAVPIAVGDVFINPVPISGWIDNENIPIDYAV
jgi:predicted phage tail protein